jgi:outer membrane receptor protein involved in Fe transport
MKTATMQSWRLLSAGVVLLFSLAALGQTPGTGAIAGSVYDPQNKTVSGAELVARSLDTHLERVAQSDAEGSFQIPLLAPGKYVVEVKAADFAPSVSDTIQVTASETTSLNIKLQLASVAQSVQVKASAEEASLESSTLGGLVDETAVQSLPLSNRNYTQILGLSPGVVVDLPSATALGSGTENVASDGATPLSNNIQFNGVDANNLAQNSAANAGMDAGTAIPAPDTIEEFRVQTANFDAAYGRGSGANVDLVSRAGTSTFHGSAWEFVRNNVLNASDFFSNLDGQPKADLKQNQFGGALGGPLVHDRDFFFAAYQGLRSVNGLGDEQNPILPLLTSDRSAATLGAQFCPAGHLDNQGQPATGYRTQAGGTQVACDGSNINPVALAILNAKLPNGQFVVPSPQITLPNSGPDASDQLPQGQSTYATPAHYSEDQFSVNLDHVLSRKNTLSERFFYSRAPTMEPFSPNAANLPGWGTNQLDRNTMLVLADTHVLNPNMVNIARFGYMRFDGDSIVENPLLAAAIGEGTPTGVASSASHAPGLTVGGWTIGDAGTPSLWQVTNSFIWQDTVALTHGRHNLRFGAEVKRHEVDEDEEVETDGLLQIATFEDFLLGESAGMAPGENQSPSGLSNISTSISGGGIFRRNERYNDFAGFAQDDWKLTPRLTLNAGLRYEIFGAASETTGRFSSFDPSLASTGPPPPGGTFSGFTLPSNYPGAIPTGVLKRSFPGLYTTPLGDVSPRLGFVWQVKNRPTIVVRGGYGIYYDRHSGDLAEQTLIQLPFAALQVVSGAPNGAATLQSPFVPLIPPSSSFPIFTPRTPTLTARIEATNPAMSDDITHEYNLNVEYGLGRGYLLDVGYVGTLSPVRSGQLEFDQALLASPQNPVFGQTSNSIGNVPLRMPVQGIGEGSLLTDSTFIGNYNALQAYVTRNMLHSFELQAGYTWSKNLDEVNNETGTDIYELQLPTNNQLDLRRSSYGPAGTDRDQRAVVNFTWASPKLAAMPAAPRMVLADWLVSGVAVAQSGIPLSIFDFNAGSVYGLITGEVRAETTGGNPHTHGSMYSRVLNGYLDPSAFTRAPEAPFGTSLADQDFGNSGVGFTRGPGQHNFDIALERSFPVREAGSFRFRTEFFNLTNTPQFGNPTQYLGYTDPTLQNPTASASFGKITSTVANPRIIQFAAKYVF